MSADALYVLVQLDDVSDSLPKNAWAAMAVAKSGISNVLSGLDVGYASSVWVLLSYNTPSFEVYCWFPSATLIAVSILQFANALLPIFCTDAGMVMARRLTQFWNAAISMLSSPSLSVTLARLVHSSKAELPMVSTLPGISISVKALQYWNAL